MNSLDLIGNLARPFRDLSDADLACLNFWLICRKPTRNP